MDIFEDLSASYDVKAVFWNRRYAARDRSHDAQTKCDLEDRDIEVCSFNGTLLKEPWEVQTQDGHPYKVFTPHWKSLKQIYERSHPSDAPAPEYISEQGDNLDDWALHPTKPDWSGGLEELWSPGEAGAAERLSTFLDDEAEGYDKDRDRPDKAGTSRLSPHLAFGEISPQQIWSAVEAAMEAGNLSETDGWSYLRELGWRDFSYSILFQAEALHEDNWNDRFDAFPWRTDKDALKRWQYGQTGYPIVDAGMRQLWKTGWMHNRVRMIVGSFLVKHLLLHWREGEAWFWDTLVDADTANNPASWQWVAGSGADASPYFRIFNPMTQGEKFDPDGDYIRKWVPELKDLPTKYLSEPWEAPKSALTKADIELGKTYPKPIVDHKPARERALEAYQETKKD